MEHLAASGFLCNHLHICFVPLDQMQQFCFQTRWIYLNTASVHQMHQWWNNVLSQTRRRNQSCLFSSTVTAKSQTQPAVHFVICGGSPALRLLDARSDMTTWHVTWLKTCTAIRAALLTWGVLFCGYQHTSAPSINVTGRVTAWPTTYVGQQHHTVQSWRYKWTVISCFHVADCVWRERTAGIRRGHTDTELQMLMMFDIKTRSPFFQQSRRLITGQILAAVPSPSLSVAAVTDLKQRRPRSYRTEIRSQNRTPWFISHLQHVSAAERPRPICLVSSEAVS